MLNSPDTIKVVTYLQTREPPRPPPGQGNKKTIKKPKINCVLLWFIVYFV